MKDDNVINKICFMVKFFGKLLIELTSEVLSKDMLSVFQAIT